jgi:hypothetical protein
VLPVGSVEMASLPCRPWSGGDAIRRRPAKILGLAEVSVVRLSHLSEADKRADILADNKFAQNATARSRLLNCKASHTRKPPSCRRRLPRGPGLNSYGLNSQLPTSQWLLQNSFWSVSVCRHVRRL